MRSQNGVPSVTSGGGGTVGYGWQEFLAEVYLSERKTFAIKLTLSAYCQ